MFHPSIPDLTNQPTNQPAFNLGLHLLPVFRYTRVPFIILLFCCYLTLNTILLSQIPFFAFWDTVPHFLPCSSLNQSDAKCGLWTTTGIEWQKLLQQFDSAFISVDYNSKNALILYVVFYSFHNSDLFLLYLFLLYLTTGPQSLPFLPPSFSHILLYYYSIVFRLSLT